MGNEKMAAQEPEEKAVWTEPFELVFREYENATSATTFNSGTTKTDLLSKGACYISKISNLEYCYKTKTNGLKLGSTKNDGALILDMYKTMYIDKIELSCRSSNGNECEITINGHKNTISSEKYEKLEFIYDKHEYSSINISNKGNLASLYINSITIYPKVETVIIPDAKFRTYTPKSGLDFTDTDVNAYAISNTAPNEGIVYLTKISKYNATSGIEKHNAIIINGSPGNHNINIIASKPEIKNPDNCMYYSPEEIDISKDGENYYYILALIDGQVGFAAVTEGTIPDRKGYFTLPKSANIKEFKFAIDNEETSIDIPKVDNGHNSQSFNLSGQRVGDNYKGIIIRNGKKYLKR